MKSTYGNRSLAALVILLIATETYYPMVLIAIERGQQAAWLITLLAGGFTALLVWPVAATLRRIPGGTLIELAASAAGPIGAIVMGVLVSATLCYLGGTMLREISEMTITAAFPKTPQTFATASLIAGACYVACGGTDSMVRLGRLLLPVVMTSILLVLAGSLGWGNLNYLLPFWGPGIPRLLFGAPQVALLFSPVILLSLLASGVHDRAGLVRWHLAVPAVGGLIHAAAKAVLMMVYAYRVGISITFPLHGAARLLVGGRFFERLEGVWMIVWVSGSIVLLGALIHGAAIAITRAFHIPRHLLAAPALTAVTLTLAFFPSDQIRTITLQETSALWVVGVSLVLPAALSLLACWRMRGRRA